MKALHSVFETGAPGHLLTLEEHMVPLKANEMAIPGSIRDRTREEVD